MSDDAAAAARVARLLRAAATGADAWVSTQARVRAAGGTWRPAVVVGEGEPPCDGLLPGPPVVAVELDAQTLTRWLKVPEVTVWVPGRSGVVALERGRVRRVRPQTVLRVRGHRWLRVRAGDLAAATD